MAAVIIVIAFICIVGFFSALEYRRRVDAMLDLTEQNYKRDEPEQPLPSRYDDYDNIDLANHVYQANHGIEPFKSESIHWLYERGINW